MALGGKGLNNALKRSADCKGSLFTECLYLRLSLLVARFFDKGEIHRSIMLTRAFPHKIRFS
jgi:hypothetical protein